MVEYEDNECLQASCKAACCHDEFFQIPMKEKQILAAFPQAIRVNKLTYEDDKLSPGIYYYQGFVRIVGFCPNLSEDNCLLYRKSTRPESCKVAQRCSDQCIQARRRDSLKQPQI